MGEGPLSFGQALQQIARFGKRQTAGKTSSDLHYGRDRKAGGGELSEVFGLWRQVHLPDVTQNIDAMVGNRFRG